MMVALSILSDHWANFEVRTLPGLHAKCICIDNQIAFVGSANWYRYSLEESLEIVLRGPISSAQGLDREFEAFWEQGETVQVNNKPSQTRVSTAIGITHEVIDPIAAQVLKENPKAFRLGKKRREGL
jgi:phosphatidylserine/phosphatidylglycerophosphate/cardiolipin synthase-like enzyme